MTFDFDPFEPIRKTLASLAESLSPAGHISKFWELQKQQMMRDIQNALGSPLDQIREAINGLQVPSSLFDLQKRISEITLFELPDIPVPAPLSDQVIGLIENIQESHPYKVEIDTGLVTKRFEVGEITWKVLQLLIPILFAYLISYYFAASSTEQADRHHKESYEQRERHQSELLEQNERHHRENQLNSICLLFLENAGKVTDSGDRDSTTD